MELLRIICMCMIVLHHFIVHYIGSPTFCQLSLLSTLDNIIIVALNPFLYCAVNVFVLISGWYGIRAKARGFINFYLRCAFFILLLFIWHRLVEGFPIGKTAFIQQVVLCLSHSSLWFIPAYVGLYILSPLLNAAVNALSKQKFKIAILLLTIINIYFGWYRGMDFNPDGFRLSQFIFLYFLGRYLNLYGNVNRYKRKIYLTGYFLCASFIALILCYISFVNPSEKWNSLLGIKYNNPVLIIESICLLLFFQSLSIKSRLINFMAVSSFAVYVMHWHKYAPSFIKQTVTDNFYMWPEGWRWLLLLLFVVGIYLIFSLVGLICSYISLFVTNWIYSSAKFLQTSIIRITHAVSDSK